MEQSFKMINWSRSNIELVDHTPRSYRCKVDWGKIYSTAENEGELIDTRWLVSKGLSKNRVSAAKLLNRHTKSGVLRAVPTYPRSYQIVNNVKLPTPNGVKSSGSKMVPVKVSDTCTIYTTITDSGKKDVQKEHPIRNTNPSTLRSQRHRKWSKVNNISDLEHPAILSGYQCLQLVKKQLPMERRMLYGELGRKVTADSACFYDAIDSMVSSPNFLRVHKPEFQFFASPPTIYEMSKKRNRGVWLSATVGGYKVNIARYKNGLVTIKSSMTSKTISPYEVVSFMQAIRQSLPFDSPPITDWRISSLDVNIDTPTKEKSKRHMEFDSGNTHISCYNKTIDGQRFLRLEAQIYPACTTKDLGAVIGRASDSLTHAIGASN